MRHYNFLPNHTVIGHSSIAKPINTQRKSILNHRENDAILKITDQPYNVVYFHPSKDTAESYQPRALSLSWIFKIALNFSIILANHHHPPTTRNTSHFHN